MGFWVCCLLTAVAAHDMAILLPGGFRWPVQMYSAVQLPTYGAVCHNEAVCTDLG